KNREVKSIIANALKISEDKVALNDDRIFTIAIEGSEEDKLYIDDIEIDVVSSFGNLEDKENIHTIFVKYNFEFKFCIFKKIDLQNGLELQKFSFENCDIKDKVDLNMSEFKSLSFCDCHFDKNTNFSYMKTLKEASFSGCNFKNEVDFANAELKNNGYGVFSECNFEKKVNFTNFTFDEDMNGLFFRDEVVFNGAKFLKKITLSKDNFTQKDIKFEKCIFEEVDIEGDFLKTKNISFKSCEFNQVIAFENETIKNLTFGMCIFNKGVYFVFCNFFDVKIYSCSFNQPASFYGSTFNMVPNFSQSIFKDSINLVNIKTNFGFEILNNTIDNIDKPRDEAVNDFRDSFRNFKSTLIKDNNLLDASNFHKYELYCKEIELKNKKGKTLKDIVDKWQLFFYRKLCDHHTDLLKVFHNLLIIIMLFSVFSFVLDKFKQPSIENNAKYHIVQVDTNESYIFKEHNKTTYNFLSLNIEQEFKNLDNLLSKTEIYFSLGFVLLVTFVALLNKKYLWFLLMPLFVGVVYCIGFPMSFITHFVIIILFACTFVFIMVFDSKPERFLFVGVSYIACIFTLLIKPSLMFPVFGSFLEKDTNATYPLLLSLSVVYFILVALVIFSLQKTARKNSIVPS
ncbi:pentapeptide repeat-containing protein, partial [Campylobacter lari]|nr:pentapeptide repeat-containing protein [Campylobacter lari]